MSPIDYSKYTFVSNTFASVKDDSSVIHVVPTIAEFEKKWDNRPITNAYQFSCKWSDMVDEDDDEEEFDDPCSDEYFKSFLVGSIPSTKVTVTKKSNEGTNITTDAIDDCNFTEKSTMFIDEKQDETAFNNNINTTSNAMNSSKLFPTAENFSHSNEFPQVHIDNSSIFTENLHSDSNTINNSLPNSFNEEIKDKFFIKNKNHSANKNIINDNKSKKKMQAFQETFYHDFPVPITKYSENDNISLFIKNIDNTFTRSVTPKKTKYSSEKMILSTNQISFGQLNSNELFKLPLIRYTPVDYKTHDKQNISIQKNENKKNTKEVKNNKVTQNSNTIEFAKNESRENFEVTKKLKEKSTESAGNMKEIQISKLGKNLKNMKDSKNIENVKIVKENEVYKTMRDVENVKNVENVEKIMHSRDLEDVKKIKNATVIKSIKNINIVKKDEANKHGKPNNTKMNINNVDINKSKSIREMEKLNSVDRVEDINIIKDKNMEEEKFNSKKKTGKKTNKTKKSKKNKNKKLVSKPMAKLKESSKDYDSEGKQLTVSEAENMSTNSLTNDNKVGTFNKTIYKKSDNILECLSHSINSSSLLSSSISNDNSDTISTTSEISDLDENDSFLILNNYHFSGDVNHSFESSNLPIKNTFSPIAKLNQQSKICDLLSLKKNTIFDDNTDTQINIFEDNVLKMNFKASPTNDSLDFIFLEKNLNLKEKELIKSLKDKKIQAQGKENSEKNNIFRLSTDNFKRDGGIRLNDSDSRKIAINTNEFVYTDNYFMKQEKDFQNEKTDSKCLLNRSGRKIDDFFLDENPFTSCNSLSLGEDLLKGMGVFPIALEDIKFHDLYEVNVKLPSFISDLTNDLYSQCKSTNNSINPDYSEQFTINKSIGFNYRLIENNTTTTCDPFLNNQYRGQNNEKYTTCNAKFPFEDFFFSSNPIGKNIWRSIRRILQPNKNDDDSINKSEFKSNRLILNKTEELNKHSCLSWNQCTMLQSINYFKHFNGYIIYGLKKQIMKM